MLPGRVEDARGAMRHLMALEPHLTATGLRARLSYMDADVWGKFSSALRDAGLPA